LVNRVWLIVVVVDLATTKGCWSIYNCNNSNMLQGGGRIGRIVMVVIAIHVKSAQIQEQEAEPQQIVAQRLLSCLQYPVPIKSSTEDLT